MSRITNTNLRAPVRVALPHLVGDFIRKDTHPLGHLSRRLDASWKRFDTSPYLPEQIHRPDYDWPGDMEGRALLATARLGQINGKTHRLIEHMDRKWSRMVNSRGYFGDVLSSGCADEQQLSSHGWVLRGACKMYDLTGEDRWLSRATAVVEGLVRNLD